MNSLISYLTNQGGFSVCEAIPSAVPCLGSSTPDPQLAFPYPSLGATIASCQSSQEIQGVCASTTAIMDPEQIFNTVRENGGHQIAHKTLRPHGFAKGLSGNSPKRSGGRGYSNSTFSHTHNHSQEKLSKTNVYLRNLPKHFNDEKLAQLVKDLDCIRSVRAVVDEVTLECKGYGFIDFVDEVVAKECMKDMKMRYPDLEIRFAKEYDADPNNLYIINLPKTWTKADLPKLREIFDEFGDIVSCCLSLERSTQLCNGTGFVRYARSEEAARAISEVNGRQLRLCGPGEGSGDPEGSSGLPPTVEVKPADHHPPNQRSNRKRAQKSLSANEAHNSSVNGMVGLGSSEGMGHPFLGRGVSAGASLSFTSVLANSTSGSAAAVLQPFENWFNRGILGYISSTYTAGNGSVLTAPFLNALSTPTTTMGSSADTLSPTQFLWRHPFNVSPSTGALRGETTMGGGPGSTSSDSVASLTNSYFNTVPAGAFNLVALPYGYLSTNSGFSGNGLGY